MKLRTGTETLAGLPRGHTTRSLALRVKTSLCHAGLCASPASRPVPVAKASSAARDRAGASPRRPVREKGNLQVFRCVLLNICIGPGWHGSQVECRPVNQRVASLIPTQGTCLGYGPSPQWGARKRQPHIDVSLFLLPSPLKNKIFKNIYTLWVREVGSAGVGWRDGEKRHTTVIE